MNRAFRLVDPWLPQPCRDLEVLLGLTTPTLNRKFSTLMIYVPRFSLQHFPIEIPIQPSLQKVLDVPQFFLVVRNQDCIKCRLVASIITVHNSDAPFRYWHIFHSGFFTGQETYKGRHKLRTTLDIVSHFLVHPDHVPDNLYRSFFLSVEFGTVLTASLTEIPSDDILLNDNLSWGVRNCRSQLECRHLPMRLPVSAVLWRKLKFL